MKKVRYRGCPVISLIGIFVKAWKILKTFLRIRRYEYEVVKFYLLCLYPRTSFLATGNELVKFFRQYFGGKGKKRWNEKIQTMFTLKRMDFIRLDSIRWKILTALKVNFITAKLQNGNFSYLESEKKLFGISMAREMDAKKRRIIAVTKYWKTANIVIVRYYLFS